MPAVAERLEEEFPWDPRLADPDLAVAKGAALYAAGQTVRLAEAAGTATGPAASLTPPGPVTPEAVRAVVEQTGLDSAMVESFGSAASNVIEAAVLSSALVPFVQVWPQEPLTTFMQVCAAFCHAGYAGKAKPPRTKPQ